MTDLMKHSEKLVGALRDIIELAVARIEKYVAGQRSCAARTRIVGPAIGTRAAIARQEDRGVVAVGCLTRRALSTGS